MITKEITHWAAKHAPLKHPQKTGGIIIILNPIKYRDVSVRKGT